jgi:hypothetical protein
MRVIARSAVLALVIALVPLASAAAHECFVVHRSDAGNTGASGSGIWFTLTLEQLYGETEDFGLPDLTPAQVDYAVALAESLGVPSSFTIRTDTTLLENARGWEKGDHATDGKGIDHFIDAYGDQLFAALFAALQNA